MKEEALLGFAYQFGLGVKEDIQKAKECYFNVKAQTEKALEEKNHVSDEKEFCVELLWGS